MTKIVRYRSNNGKRRRLLTGLNDAYGVYTGRRAMTRTDVRRSVRMLQRGYRSYRKRKASRIKSSPLSGIQYQTWEWGTPTSNANGFETIERKTLALRQIEMCRPPNTNETIGAAPGMTFKLSGIKVCAQFVNTGGDPVELHWAIVQSKDPGETAANITDQFFSDPNASTTRTRAFVNFTTNADYDNRNLCQGINTRNVNVLTHKRMVLSPQNDGTFKTIDNQPYTKKVHKYFPMGKRFSFETTVASNVERPMWIAIWHERNTLSAATSNPIQVSLNTVGYLKRAVM
ncbi:capsid protein [Mute swan feces associated circular virus 8]|nr:capsid protein [Mute swan feces associated circular virus 8]